MVSNSSGRNSVSCLKGAFSGFALVDANIHGMAVAKHLLQSDRSWLDAFEEGKFFEAIFPLCENESMTGYICDLELEMCHCWRERTKEMVSADNQRHMALLERLWKGCNPSKPFPGKASKEWKELGFQGESPLSDFRSMGVLALEHLVYFVEKYSTEAKMIISAQNTADEEFYYPVATAGINVTSIVLSAVENRLKSRKECPVLLSDSLNKVWVSVMRHLDVVFVESKFTYLQFSEATKVVSSNLNDALAQNPPFADDLYTILKEMEEEKKGKSKKTRSNQWRTGGGVRKEKKEVVTIPSLTTSPTSTSSTTSSSSSQPKPVPSKTPRGNYGGMKSTKAMGKKLRKAAATGDVKKVIELLGGGEGVYSIVNDPDPDSKATALHLACTNGHKDCVTLILGAGAALESVATGLGTPLHCAAISGNVGIVTTLLDQGAKINATCGFAERTPLAVACDAGNAEVVKVFVERGADISIEDADGNVAADLWNGSSDIARMLGKKGKRVSILQSSATLKSSPIKASATIPGLSGGLRSRAGTTTSGASSLAGSLGSSSPVISEVKVANVKTGDEVVKFLVAENVELRALISSMADTMKKLESEMETLKTALKQTNEKVDALEKK